MRAVSVDVLLALAVLAEIVCVVGLLAAATAVDRLHFSGATSAVAPFLVLAALVVQHGVADPSLNGLFDAVALVVLNAAVTHATARVARQRAERDVEL